MRVDLVGTLRNAADALRKPPNRLHAKALAFDAEGPWHEYELQTGDGWIFWTAQLKEWLDG